MDRQSSAPPAVALSAKDREPYAERTTRALTADYAA
jgi:hypothetical protein